MNQRYVDKYIHVIYELLDYSDHRSYKKRLKALTYWGLRRANRYNCMGYDYDPVIKAVDKIENLLESVFSIGWLILERFGKKFWRDNSCPHCRMHWENDIASEKYITEHLGVIYDFLDHTDYQTYKFIWWDLSYWALFVDPAIKDEDYVEDNEDLLVGCGHIADLIEAICSIGILILETFGHKIPEKAHRCPHCNRKMKKCNISSTSK